MQNIHPVVVHFPLALLATGILLEGIGLLAGNKPLRAVAACNLALGTVGAAGAVITGLWAESTVPHAGGAHEVMTVHKYLGLLLLALAVVLVVWRWRAAEPMAARARAAYLSLAAVVLALALGTGHWGGRLVFEHHVGTAPVPSALTEEEAGHSHSHGGHDEAESHTGHEH
ncbi:MAG: DUF2231 domain-containing protein [Armatimonadetes bacterium]|nr:DUF2231 domain-containing protein [Armatimonadota bacterium]